MNFFDYIREWFIWATQVLVNAALYCYKFGWPLTGLGDWFNSLSDWTAEVSGWLWVASQWYDDVVRELSRFLVWEYWVNLWQTWYNRLAEVWNWFSDWVSQVTAIVSSWWEGIRTTILDWIDAATRGLAALEAEWRNFWYYTLPGLFDQIKLATWWQGKLDDINRLITGKLEEWLPFYNELTSLWQDITEFFADPLEWLWAKFADWFLGRE